jgi:hypothetical protein
MATQLPMNPAMSTFMVLFHHLKMNGEKAGVIATRTQPYFELCLLMALAEQCWYRDHCPKRNRGTVPDHARLTDGLEKTVSDLVATVLFISGSHHSKLHPLQIIPFHSHLLYTSFNNRYTNTRALMKQFEDDAEDEKQRQVEAKAARAAERQRLADLRQEEERQRLEIERQKAEEEAEKNV